VRMVVDGKLCDGVAFRAVGVENVGG
jgi:hypothetical protein